MFCPAIDLLTGVDFEVDATVDATIEVTVTDDDGQRTTTSVQRRVDLG